jgi:hypothetical protein
MLALISLDATRVVFQYHWPFNGRLPYILLASYAKHSLNRRTFTFEFLESSHSENGALILCRRVAEVLS